jgi:hypothetical protein
LQFSKNNVHILKNTKKYGAYGIFLLLRISKTA